MIITNNIIMSSIFTHQKPFIRQLPSDTITISNYDISLSNNIHYPDLTLGFTHFFHKSADNFVNSTTRFQERKKVYLVTQDFEPTIEINELPTDLTPTSIFTEFNAFIKTNYDMNNITLQSCIKMWELNCYFDIINDKGSINIYNFGENDGGMLQTCLMIRGKNNKDIYYSSEISDAVTENILKDNYKKQLLISSKEPPNKSADLIICDCQNDTSNMYAQEQNFYKVLINNINNIINIQAVGGNLILRIVESYTYVTVKMIEFLKLFYNECYICKPFMSVAFISERYVIFKDFKKTKIPTNEFNTLTTEMKKNNQYNIYDIFTETKISKKIMEFYIDTNIDFALLQYRSVNKILIYIKNNNFNGADFNDYYEKQIETAHYFKNIFLTDGVYNKINKILDDICKIEMRLQDDK